MIVHWQVVDCAPNVDNYACSSGCGVLPEVGCISICCSLFPLRVCQASSQQREGNSFEPFMNMRGAWELPVGDGVTVELPCVPW